MEVNLNKLIMGIFSKTKKINDIKPMGVLRTIDRPNQPVSRISKEQMDKLKVETEKRVSNRKVDPYFLQEISDRLYGPESKEYIDALIELNKKFKPRVGRTGHDIFKD
jgi:hypothetical protein